MLNYLSINFAFSSAPGGVSLAKSGIVPIGRGFPQCKPGRIQEELDQGEVNLHLLPTNSSSTENYGAHCTSRPEKEGTTIRTLGYP